MNPVNDSITAHAVQKFEFTIRLSESEARVLWAMFCYGKNPLMEACLKMGTHYMQQAGDYEAAFTSLHAKIYHCPLPQQLARADAARKAFNGETK